MLGLQELEAELRDTDVFQVLNARRVAPTETDKLMHLVPYPAGVDVKNPLPEWRRLPLSGKIPYIRSPKDYTVYKRGKLGESVIRQGDTFDLSDPYNYGLSMKYEPIHDKHLRNYFYSAGNKKILEDMGLLTKEDQVKCKLSEYNAYRGYVYNVHKNSVIKAIREKENIEADKAQARLFMEAAARLRENQRGTEKRLKASLRRAAQRRVTNACQQLLCESRLKRLEKVNEKMEKQKEHEHLKLLVNQKNFHEQLKNYKIKSQEVNWQRNIRAQKKWKKVLENEEYRKLVTTQVDKIRKLNQVSEYWIKKEIHQLKTRERNCKVYGDYRKFSEKRRSARDRYMRLRQIENANKMSERKCKVGRSRSKEELYKSMGDIFAGVKSIPPNMKSTVYEKPILKGIMEKAVGDVKLLIESEITDSILQCVYIRVVKLYLRHAIFRQLPLLFTELKHVVILFEEDMTRKKFSVDEIRRFVRSYVGQDKGNIFHTPEPLTSYAYLGRLKRKLYRSRKSEGFCRCNSESEGGQQPVVKFCPQATSAFLDTDKRVSFTVGDQGPSKRTVVKPQAIKQKSKKKQLTSILKHCPFLQKKTADDQEAVCCNNLTVMDVCDCNNNVKKVSFSAAITKLDTPATIRESETEKNVRVSFDNKTKVILVPLECNTRDEIPTFSTEMNKANIRHFVEKVDKSHTESEDVLIATESEATRNIDLQSREVGQKRLSFKDDKKLINDQIDLITSDNLKYQTSKHLKGKFAKEMKSSSSDDFSKSMNTDMFEKIKKKFVKQDESKNISGCINFSSSSTDPSSSGNVTLEEQEHKTVLDGGRHRLVNSNFTCDGVEIKNIKETNENDECKTQFNIKKGYSSQLMDFIQTDCKFLQRKKKLSNDQLKENLKIMFGKYITRQESAIGSSMETCVKEEDEGDYYSGMLNEQFLISEPLVKTDDDLSEEFVDKTVEVKLKSITKSLASFKFKDDLTCDDMKRGTYLRDCPVKHAQSNLSEVPKAGTDSNQFAKYFLRQVFAPTYKPKYSKDDNGNNSILVKSPYSPAENCVLVPKYMKEYKFKDVDELKNFVELQVNISEPEALAAVKTEKNVNNELPKSDKIDVDALSQYSKEVIPGGSEEYKNYIRKSRVVYSEQKKDVAEMYGWEEDNQSKEGPFETSMLGKTMSLTKLSTKAAPEINRIFSEFFERDWPEVPQNEPKKYKTEERKSSAEGVRKAFQTPEDVIQDSKAYKELCQKGEIRFLTKYPTGEKKIYPNNLLHKDMEKLQIDKCSVSSDCELPRVSETHKFSFLQANLFKPDEVKMCGVCNTCPISVGGEFVREQNTANFLECGGCGACVHDLMDSYSESTSDNCDIQTSKQPQANPQSSSESSQQDITFLNDAELKEIIFKKRTKHLLGFADLRGVFGPGFDPDKFIYFIKDGKDYIFWKDILNKRYPLKPFPWNGTKLSRLEKKKLPISEIKNYTHPNDILRNKVAKGYEMWEKTKMMDLDGSKEEMKWNKVPNKYEKLFSTTVTPANRPARTLKPIRDRRPTPMPSTTDLVMHVVEESGGDLHCARRMVHDLRLQAGLVKCKVDTAVRALVEAITVIAILKLKEGYPSLRKSLARNKTRFYYQPTGYHKHYAGKLAGSLGEVLYALDVKQYNFARLQPLVDIILKNILNPGKYPLVFPESARDLIDETNSVSSITTNKIT